MFGFRTVREGQHVAVWNRRGQVRLVDGPKRLFLFRETLEWLEQHRAKPGEYLAVRYKDGRSEHLCGPVAIWRDPVRHESVAVLNCLPVDANEAIVVYRREGDKVLRRIERGPALFMPGAEEWLHEFSWHAADPKNPDRKVPHGQTFSKLRVIPDQMYFNVESVRTADDALLTVKLMIFFELVNIERMLDQTHDVVADFINAVSADVIDFVATRDFEQFKKQTESLNDLTTYRQVTGRAERIGYRINKVVYRGYLANQNLQAMHDHAIEARTKLRLEAETEEQAQGLADLKLRREADRSKERQAMEMADATHRTEMLRREHDEQMRQKKVELEAELDEQGRKNAVELERQRATNAERAGYLARMKEMQVDLTRYLVAQYQNPDRVIRVEGEGRKPQLHLHEN